MLGRADGSYEGEAVGVEVGGSLHTYSGISLAWIAFGRMAHSIKRRRVKGDLMVVCLLYLALACSLVSCD